MTNDTDEVRYDTLDDLVAAARALLGDRRRVVLGIPGSPGSGKSTLGEHLATALADVAVLVGMDGFHLAQEELDRLGRHERKGAPDTFDALGYVNLLRRLRVADEDVVYAPRFDRDLEEPIACAVPVRRDVRLVITEGNYLLVDQPGWSQVRELLDACWYVDPGEDVRIERLIARHVGHGRSVDEARERSLGTDQRNAEVIALTRSRADRVVVVPPSNPGTPGRHHHPDLLT